jgi:hypothetical protein
MSPEGTTGGVAPLHSFFDNLSYLEGMRLRHGNYAIEHSWCSCIHSSGLLARVAMNSGDGGSSGTSWRGNAVRS